MCCSSSSYLKKSLGSEQRRHSGDSRCLTKWTGFYFGHEDEFICAHCQLASMKFHHAHIKIPVLGIDLLIAEIDIVLLLTVELLIGQTGEGLQFFHEHHLKTAKNQTTCLHVRPPVSKVRVNR